MGSGLDPWWLLLGAKDQGCFVPGKGMRVLPVKCSPHALHVKYSTSWDALALSPHPSLRTCSGFSFVISICLPCRDSQKFIFALAQSYSEISCLRLESPPLPHLPHPPLMLPVRLSLFHTFFLASHPCLLVTFSRVDLCPWTISGVPVNLHLCS